MIINLPINNHQTDKEIGWFRTGETLTDQEWQQIQVIDIAQQTWVRKDRVYQLVSKFSRQELIGIIKRTIRDIRKEDEPDENSEYNFGYVKGYNQAYDLMKIQLESELEVLINKKDSIEDALSPEPTVNKYPVNKYNIGDKVKIPFGFDSNYQVTISKVMVSQTDVVYESSEGILFNEQSIVPE